MTKRSETTPHTGPAEAGLLSAPVRAALRAALLARGESDRPVPLRMVDRHRVDRRGYLQESPELVRYLTAHVQAEDLVTLAARDATLGDALQDAMATVEPELARIFGDYRAALAQVPGPRRRGLPAAKAALVAERYGRSRRWLHDKWLEARACARACLAQALPPGAPA